MANNFLDKAAIFCGGVSAASLAITLLVGDNEKKLKKLDEEFKECETNYLEEKAKLEKKIAGGNERAKRKLAELEEEFSCEKKEYEKKRQKLLPKKKKSKQDKELEIIELEHKHAMEKLEVEHAHQMQEMEFAQRNKNNEKDNVEIKCKACGEMNPQKAKFCCSCGAEIIKIKFCSNCGAELKAGSNFCSDCGAKT